MRIGPQPDDLAPTADEAWHDLLTTLIANGLHTAPRGQPTYEVLHHVNLTVDLNHPVIVCPERRLNYRFMAAEALWIADARNDVESLTKFNPRMAEFSDDGQTLAGAYGPRISPQLDYVVGCLRRDRDTRQAALTIWTPRPGPSKDVPCTVAMVFSIRHDKLYAHVFMRSSDAWLGIPYDVFSFSLVAIDVACRYNNQFSTDSTTPVGLGHLTITATSSHLYERDLEKAQDIVSRNVAGPCQPVPESLVASGSWSLIYNLVQTTRDAPKGSPGPFQEVSRG